MLLELFALALELPPFALADLLDFEPLGEQLLAPLADPLLVVFFGKLPLRA